VKPGDLEKVKGTSITARMNQAATPGRFAKDAALPFDRREQRKRDQELGLVPFAVKLNVELVQRIRTLAQERATGLNELVAELLKKGLDA
jgi:hypothetical protein